MRGVMRSALIVVVASVTLGPSVGAVAQTAPAKAASSFAAPGWLDDVAALSPTSAWAVGGSDACHPKTLMARWNGSAWHTVRLPAGARRGELNGVAVTSARNAWAVGSSGGLIGHHQSLILHWSGTAWTREASPGAAGGVSLIAIAATSARHAWAVGYTGRYKIFIMRWDGHTWRRARTPRPARPSVPERRGCDVAKERMGRRYVAQPQQHGSDLALERHRLDQDADTAFASRQLPVNGRSHVA